MLGGKESAISSALILAIIYGVENIFFGDLIAEYFKKNAAPAKKNVLRGIKLSKDEINYRFFDTRFVEFFIFDACKIIHVIFRNPYITHKSKYNMTQYTC